MSQENNASQRECIFQRQFLTKVVFSPSSWSTYYTQCNCCSSPADFQSCMNLITKLTKITGGVPKISLDCTTLQTLTSNMSEYIFIRVYATHGKVVGRKSALGCSFQIGCEILIIPH